MSGFEKRGNLAHFMDSLFYIQHKSVFNKFCVGLGLKSLVAFIPKIRVNECWDNTEGYFKKMPSKCSFPGKLIEFRTLTARRMDGIKVLMLAFT